MSLLWGGHLGSPLPCCPAPPVPFGALNAHRGQTLRHGALPYWVLRSRSDFRGGGGIAVVREDLSGFCTSRGSQLCAPTPRQWGPLSDEPVQSKPQRPRGGSLPPAPSVMPGRCYGSIWLPRGFRHLRLGWLDAFPLGWYPSHILVAESEEDAEVAPDDADSAFRAKVRRRKVCSQRRGLWLSRPGDGPGASGSPGAREGS